MNPGVSLAFALRRDFPWRRVPGYILAQLVGAVIAALFLYAVFGDAGNLGTTTPRPAAVRSARLSVMTAVAGEVDARPSKLTVSCP
ncbi:MAG: aquaporin [Solirubrobacterales bacterium]